MKRIGTTALALLLLSGCPDNTTQATVTLEIDGKKHDYVTRHAEYDQQVEGGDYSVYLLRDEGDDARDPFIGIRFYCGNPVARLWLRYALPGADPDDDLGRWECFVPGKLSDGRDTLSWKKDDGSDRARQATGESSCQASVKPDGDELVVSFDATLSPRAEKRGKGKKAKAAKGEEGSAGVGARAKISGSARVKLRR